MTTPKKSLGQNWLKDRIILVDIASYAHITKDDNVVEIGSGLGTLTSVLLKEAKKVTAVEIDKDLATKLPGQFPGKNLEVINQDILTVDLETFPKNYKVVANIPYYITNKIINYLISSKNKPSIIVLLVQKEVAQRITAKPGSLNLLALDVQTRAKVEAGIVVPAEYFFPQPKVDSQVVIISPFNKPLFTNPRIETIFFRIIRGCFSMKRKKIKTGLANALSISVSQAELILKTNKISADLRPEQLGIDDWLRLTMSVSNGPDLKR